MEGTKLFCFKVTEDAKEDVRMCEQDRFVD